MVLILLMYYRCIIQDDVEDWRTESITMRAVYSNATLCIAATAAQDCNSGLFVERDLSYRTHIKMRITWQTIRQDYMSMPDGDYCLSTGWVSSGHNIDSATLNHRAWV